MATRNNCEYNNRGITRQLQHITALRNQTQISVFMLQEDIYEFKYDKRQLI